MAISVYIMEEHKEAYYYWHLMQEKNEIKATGNYLLHIDHHDDAFAGRYSFDLEVKPTLEEAKHRAYEVLGIGDFIAPAIYEGLFDHFYYLRNFDNKTSEVAAYVKKEPNDTLTIRYMNELLKLFGANKALGNISRYQYIVGGMGKLVKAIEQPLVLDVDLDYFAWDNSLSSAGNYRIEITKEQYEEIIGDTYHPLRIQGKPQYTYIEEAGHYYLESLKGHSREIPSKEKILERMNNLFAWFKEADIQPAAIDICRSRLSGYLPRTLFPWIEEEFLTRLGKAYDIHVITATTN